MPAAQAASFRRTGWLLLAAMLAAASPAYAQSDEALARARSEFREAIALQAAGDYAGALAKLHAVAAVRTTPQVRFNIAVCEKNLGKLTTALGSFTLAESDALDQNLTEIAENAREHIDDIEARVPKLTIARGEGAEAASIDLDGVSLGASVIGTEMNVDPGPHTIVARVGEKIRFSTTIELVERGRERVVVHIERPAEPAEAPVTEAAPSLPPAPADQPPRDEGWSRRHTAFVSLGVGGAATAAGVVFLVLRGGAISDLDAVCHGGRCPPSSESMADRGKLYTGLAGASLAVGAVGLAIGGVMLFSEGGGEQAGDDLASASRPHLAFTVGAPGAAAGAGFVGRF